MKVLYVSAYYDESIETGANKRFREIAKILDETTDLTVLIPSQKSSMKWCKSIVSFRSKALGRIGMAVEIYVRLKIHKYDCVITDLVPTIPGKNVYYLTHDLRQFTEFRRHKHLINDLVYKLNLVLQKKIITVSEFTKSEIKRITSTKAKIIVTPNGIEGSSYPVLGTRKKYDLIYVATFEPRKNHDILIKAIRLYGRLYGENLSFCLVGRDLGCRWAIMDLIKELGLEGQCKYVESCSHEELAELYAQSRIFCTPSVYEGFGMPILEAMMHRLPLICSDIEVFREVGKDFCHFFSASSEKDLVKAIREVKSEPTDHSDDALVEQYLSNYTWQNVARGLLNDIKSDLK